MPSAARRRSFVWCDAAGYPVVRLLGGRGDRGCAVGTDVVAAWPDGDGAAIAALYSDTVTYRSPAFRSPDLGLAGVHRYLAEHLPAEQNLECWFGQPITAGDRSAVEWWASWTEDGRDFTYAWVTILRFDDDGQVIEHRDYDNHRKGREPPYPGW